MNDLIYLSFTLEEVEKMYSLTVFYMSHIKERLRKGLSCDSDEIELLDSIVNKVRI